MQQYNVLRILRGAGEKGLPTLEIAERMLERSPGITRLLERLEAKQLVRRKRCNEDRRQVLCHATAEALALLDAVDGPLEQAAARLLAPLDARRTAELVRSLDAIRGGSPAASQTLAAERSRRPDEGEEEAMNTRFAVLAAALLAASPALAADTYNFDKSHTTVAFQVRHIFTNMTGKFREFEGAIQIDRAKPSASSVEFTIQAASIDTNDAKRDEHLRTADFFDVANHPKLAFKSTSVRPAGKDTYQVTGDLTMRGVTKPVTLTVAYLGEGKDPWGNEKVGFDVTGTLNRKDFDIIWNKALDAGGYVVGDEVKVLIGVEANKAKAATASTK